PEDGPWQSQQFPPANTLKNASISASVAKSPSPLKSEEPQREGTERPALVEVVGWRVVVNGQSKAAQVSSGVGVWRERVGGVGAPVMVEPGRVGRSGRFVPLRRHW